MNELVICILLYLGAALILLASIGLIKFPDLFTRMQASTKASSLGLSLMLLATILLYRDPQVTLRSVAIIVFIFLTAPVGAHMLARVAYILKVPFWEGTICDELKSGQKHSTSKTPASKPTKAKTSRGGSKISDIFKGLKGKKID